MTTWDDVHCLVRASVSWAMEDDLLRPPLRSSAQARIWFSEAHLGRHRPQKDAIQWNVRLREAGSLWDSLVGVDEG